MSEIRGSLIRASLGFRWALFALFTALGALTPGPGSAESVLSDAEALALIRRRVADDHLYSRMDCISSELEGKDEHFISIALREIHNETCGGDPDVAPVLDRYRIDRTSKSIEWYDVLDDEYRPYREALKSRRR